MSGSSKARVARKLAAEGACRLCRRPSRVRPLTRHRIYPGRLGGTYRQENVVPLCRVCHDLIDDHRDRDPDEWRTLRRMLRACLWPHEHAYAARLFALLGPDAFDRHYPRPARELVQAVRRAA